MANFTNHHRTRRRNTSYCTIGLTDIKKYLDLPVNSIFMCSWKSRQKPDMELRIKRLESSLFVFTDTDTDFGYYIELTTTKVTYGTRWWYKCPSCNRRCGILYYSTYLACRLCHNLSYESQNGYKQNYLANRIREERKRIWGDHMECFIDDLSLSCDWWGKPKHRHKKKFDKDKEKILMLEAQYKKTVPHIYLKYVFQ